MLRLWKILIRIILIRLPLFTLLISIENLLVVLRSKTNFLIQCILISDWSFFSVGVTWELFFSRNFLTRRSWSISSFGKVDNLLMFKWKVLIKLYKNFQCRTIGIFVILKKVDIFICITHIIKIKSFHCFLYDFKGRIHIKSFSQCVRLFVLLPVSLKGL